MANRIKGITVEIGGDTKGLSKALSGVNKEISDTQSQLKDVNRLLKLDPGNTELLKQKYNLLNKSIGATETKLDSLKEAEKQVQAQFQRGDIGEDQYNALKREISATEINLRNLKSEAKKTKNSIDGIDEKPIEDVARAADDAEDSLKDAGKEASNFGDYLKAGAIVEGSKAIVSGLKDIAEESKEFLKIMGSLEISSQNAGYSTEQTADSYKTLYGVLADDQTAATTTANLQALKLSQDKLKKIINGTIGAWATYGDSIPIDGLAESINETVKTGSVTGTFADVLNWAGTSEDDFNKKLQATNSESKRANLILQELANQGLIQAGEAWQDNNKALVDNNKANADLQEQLARLGETIMPVITTITQGIADLLEWFNGLSPEMQEFIGKTLLVIAAIGPVSGLISNITTSVQGVSSAISFLVSNPIVLLIAAIIALVVLIAVKGDEIQKILQKVDDFLQNVFAKDWTEVLGPVLGEALNTLFANIKNAWDSIKQIWDGIIDFIRGVFTGDWERAWEGVQKIFKGIFDRLVTTAKAPINGIIGLLNIAISGINALINGLNGMGFDLPDWLGGGSFRLNIPNIPKIPYLAKGGVLSKGSAVVGEAGPELITMMGNKAVVQPLTNQTTNTTNNTFGGITVNVYSSGDLSETAELIAEEIQQATLRKGMVFA